MNHIRNSIIAGIGCFIPQEVITNSDIDVRLKSRGNGNIRVGSFIEGMTGIKERRYAPDGIHSSDLAAYAAEAALNNAGLKPEDLDTILFTSCSRDLGEPATACIVQHKLGAYNAKRVMDVSNACNSFLSGLDVMNSLISTGQAKTGLVVSGEKLSAFVNWDLKDQSDLKSGFAALTLGDGGGAIVLTANNGNNDRGILVSHFFSDGSQWELSVVMGGGCISPRNAIDSYFRCDALKLNSLALKHLPDVIGKVLDLSGYSSRDIDLVVPHQVSYSIIEHISKRFDYPIENIMVTLDKYGNIGAASVPIALSIAIEEGRIGRGSRVLLVVGAAGFSAGSMIITI